jgi:hypothetical protein
MSPSNSLASNIFANNAQFNRADIRNLNVRNNLLVKESNFTKDDALMVLITLNISNANLYKNYIEFDIENLRLTEWTNRSINSEKVFNSFYEHEGEDALKVLVGLFLEEVQGKYNISDNPANAVLNLKIDYNKDYYITITDLYKEYNKIQLFFTQFENLQEIIPQNNIDVKVVIDIFISFAIVALTVSLAFLVGSIFVFVGSFAAGYYTGKNAAIEANRRRNS